ncbi:fucolectin-5-like isoform X1 [Antedon mediterranea]|uniref:fucolectin-5-like isoform X1 n=1 Tax=Antedon mediterranea TaxID=105859 RepID=UPI003AF9F1C3
MAFLHISTSKIIQSCYNTFELVSEFKTTRQSTTHGNGPASYAVDGGINGQYSKRTCTHTTFMNNPWWYVDLGTEKVISKIVIFNREDCCAERLAGAEVCVGNNKAPPFSGNAQCALTISRMDAIAINPIEMSCNPPISGRYVTAYKQLRGYLTFM